MGFQCQTCLKEFVTRYEYERHINRKRPCGEGDFKCNGCGQHYKSQKTLDVHQKDHCKGKNNALLARELTDEVEQLKTRLEQQDQLMQMTNQVTAAASSSSSASNAQFISSNYGTQNNIQNNLTINLQSLPVTSSLGDEQLSHFLKLSKGEALQKLNLSHTPEAMAAWCALVRADEEHPENHNALLLAPDSVMMACSRNGNWSMEEREKLLLEIVRCDMLRFYNHLNRYEGNEAAMSFRNEYLLHHLMNQSNSGETKALDNVIKAIAKPIIDLTLKNYAVPKEDDMTAEQKQINIKLKKLQTAFEQDQLRNREQEARNMALLLELRRCLINDV